MTNHRNLQSTLTPLLAALFLVSCGGGGGGDLPGTDVGHVWKIEDDGEVSDAAEQDATLFALFVAANGDTIQFGEGTFDFDTTLVMARKSGITIKGMGMKKTILNFASSRSAEGFSMSHMDGIFFEDLTVIDTPGFSIKVSDSDHVVMRNVRTMWSSSGETNGMDPEDPTTLDVECQANAASQTDSVGTYTAADGSTRNYVVSEENGGYAIYPVLSENVLLDNVVAIGASDAGIYVGQSNDVIIKNSYASFNVAGYEIENTNRADMFDNLAECNTAGFLIFDLPGLNQYGDQTRAFDNVSRYNNTANFAPGGIVSAVPQGIGFLAFGYDGMEIFNNVIEHNRSVGFVYASHELIDGGVWEEKAVKDSDGNDTGETRIVPKNSDLRMDLYPEGINLHDNTFTTNGYSPQPPEDGAIICAPGTGPGFDSVPPCVPTDFDDGHDSLLPTLIQIKGAQAGDQFGPTGAHVVWDGMFDEKPYDIDSAESYPDRPLCESPAEWKSLEDKNGKPQYTGQHHPTCRYNAYKFKRNGAGEFLKDDDGNYIRRHPDYFACFAGNTFSSDSRTYMSFKDTDPSNPPDIDVTVHDCPTRFGKVLAPLKAAVVKKYVAPAPSDTRASNVDTLAVCRAFSGTTVNYDALAYNCPLLSHYNLFESATDPRTNPNGNGQLFDLNTALFSDYAVKYRFVFLPPGKKAQWVADSKAQPNKTLQFPVGSVIAKTFAFRDGADEEVVETRLLIHRHNPDGNGTFWQGMAYIWDKDEAGNRTDAQLAVSGGTASVSWNFPDPDPDVTATYVGATENYQIPHPNQCDVCHAADDKDAGAAPIGPKARALNRPLDVDGTITNQLQHWKDSGLLQGAPALADENADFIADNVDTLPRFNVPGDPVKLTDMESHQAPGTEKYDKEVRTKAWLETNCAHCHNERGQARSTGVFLDVYRTVNLSYGICKSPTTAGRSSGGNEYDIVPGNAAGSIMSYRVHAENASDNMPPLARSVNHDEGVAALDDWINTVVDGNYGPCGE